MLEINENKEFIKEKQDIERKLDDRSLDDKERIKLENRLNELSLAINTVLVKNIEDERTKIKEFRFKNPIRTVTEARKLLKNKHDKYILLTRQVREIEKHLVDTKRNGKLLLEALKGVRAKEKNKESYSEADREVFRNILKY